LRGPQRLHDDLAAAVRQAASVTARTKSPYASAHAERGVAGGGMAHATIRQRAPRRLRQWQRVGHVQAPGMRERLQPAQQRRLWHVVPAAIVGAFRAPDAIVAGMMCGTRSRLKMLNTTRPAPV